MPRGNKLQPSHILAKDLILGDPKAGKTEWAMKAVEAGFNVLYADGDVAGQTISAIDAKYRDRIYYIDIADRLDAGLDPRMVNWCSDFFTSSRFLWNDTKQESYSKSKDAHDPETGACLDEIWDIRPARLDHNWVFVLDSWTTLAYSTMVAKAIDEGISLADIEKAERNMYQGTGNRLTNMLSTIQKMQCHVIVIGHPRQYEKRRSPDGVTVKEAMKENAQVIEWTKMVPASSSNPHGLTMGKYFSDIGWIDIDRVGKRQMTFDVSAARVSGGHLTGKGDPRGDFSFANLLRKIGADLPDPVVGAPLGDGLKVWTPGTFIPAAAKPAAALGIGKPKPDATPASESLAPAQATQVKGIGGLAGLIRK